MPTVIVVVFIGTSCSYDGTGSQEAARGRIRTRSTDRRRRKQQAGADAPRAEDASSASPGSLGWWQLPSLTPRAAAVLRFSAFLGNAWTMTKGKRTATCELFSHQFGWDLRLNVGELLRRQVCRSGDEVPTRQEEWRVALEQRGYAS